nr:PREDICTED: sialin-like [Bemisia tabaci]
MVLVRTKLWYFVFTGFAINTMLKSSINFTIIAMVKSHGHKNIPPENGTILEPHNSTDFTTQGITLSKIIHFIDKEMSYNWDAKEQGVILGSIYWLQWTTGIPSGILVRYWGTKALFGLGSLILAFTTLAIPTVAQYGVQALVGLRVAQGLVAGTMWPAVHHMAAQWIPANERSKFVSAYLGNTMGVALTYPLCGLIISFFPWQYVYYVTGSLGTLWCILWLWFVYDSPLQHPTITKDERNHILTSTDFSIDRKRPPIPWRAILTSRPLWINILAQWGGMWGFYTLLTQAPSYFKQVHRLNIQLNGLFSGLPYLFKTAFAYGYAIYTDKLLKSQRIGRTAVRKLATFVCITLQGFLLIGLAFSSTNVSCAVFFLIVATMVHGAVTSGPITSYIDLSPNFASILQGISGTVNVWPGFLSPMLAGYLTYNNQTPDRWQLVFIISGASMIVPGLIHLAFADSRLQPWNEGNSAYQLNKYELKRLKVSKRERSQSRR